MQPLKIGANCTYNIACDYGFYSLISDRICVINRNTITVGCMWIKESVRCDRHVNLSVQCGTRFFYIHDGDVTIIRTKRH